MSYILDALRKADAERERDPARGIHAQPLVAQPAAQRQPVAAWAGAGVVAVALAGYAWSQRGGEAPPLPERGPVAAMQAAVVPALAPTVNPVATSVQPPPPLPEPVKTAAAPPAAPAAAKPAPLPKAEVSATATKAETPAERIYALTELPPDVQQALPKLAIAGGVYSENAAQRMLIVGGQVVNEGTEVAPGVVLVQISARSAVLRFRGYKYSVIY